MIKVINNVTKECCLGKLGRGECFLYENKVYRVESVTESGYIEVVCLNKRYSNDILNPFTTVIPVEVTLVLEEYSRW